MFKKLLLFIGLGSLLLVGGCVAFLFWAQQSGAKLQAKFFESVVSGDPQQVLQLCDPRLREKIDAPVLGAWMNEVRGKLGKYNGMSGSNFNTSINSTDSDTVVESKGTVHFEHGDAAAELKFTNDLLTAFSIDSDKIVGDWFKGPTDTKLYRDRGEQFIRKFFAKDLAGIAAMMHEDLRKDAPEEKIKELLVAIVDQAGPLKSVTFRDEKFTTDDGQSLRIHYDVDAERAKLTAEIKFSFIDLQGHLLGFNFKERDE